MNQDPWEMIPTPLKNNQTSLVRAPEGSHEHKFWRGKDASGNYVFQYSGKFNLKDRKLPQSANVTLSLTEDPRFETKLTFSLQDPELRSLFRHLTNDMIDASAKFEGQKHQVVVDIILTRFSRWLQMLGKARNEVMPLNKILGLFGELAILKDYMLKFVNHTEAIDAWRGPLGDEQDFSLSKILLEVKSQFASKDSKVEISSSFQLDETSGSIRLCHQTFFHSSEAVPPSKSLNSIVDEIRKMLGSKGDAYDRFEAMLMEIGYTNKDEYNSPSFMLNKRQFYRVDGNFPRIRAVDLPAGIESVRYKVDLTKCGIFEISEAELTKELFNV